MESAEWSKGCQRVFTLLAGETGWKDFRFPQGKATEQSLECCRQELQAFYGTISAERLVDFCICQGYRLWGFGEPYRSRWRLSHSFGKKAIDRFLNHSAGLRYYENLWLRDYGLSREILRTAIADRRHHPLFCYIYPEYEEYTKSRLLSTEAGYVVCGLSTLLWTPFSGACRQCRWSEKCQERTARCYPELYRLRYEAWVKREVTL